MMKKKKAVFVCCARNSAPVLGAVLNNIARISSLFGASAVLILENDSRDTTREVIAAWCEGQPNAYSVTVRGLSDNPVRTLCLASVRNLALDAVREKFPAFDYLFMVDGDEVNAGEIDLESVSRAMDYLAESPDRAGVFANSGGAYFDLWALRHPELCPGDVWEELADYVIAHRVSDAQAYEHTLAKRVFTLAGDAPPLEVDSAFGGLGIYKMSHVLDSAARYAGAKMKADLGWQVCEHVAFHAGLRAEGGRLFVLPWLVNCRTADAVFPASAWRSFLFHPKAPGVPAFAP